MTDGLLRFSHTDTAFAMATLQFINCNNIKIYVYRKNLTIFKDACFGYVFDWKLLSCNPDLNKKKEKKEKTFYSSD